MKIWIDLINTPQVSFWAPFIKEFENENHEIILTCRNSSNTIQLLKQQGFDYQIIGHRVGKGILQKLLLFSSRILKLYNFISKHKPDIAASQSSFYQPIIACLFGIPCLYTNDNEHAKGNLFGFLFAKKVILPIALIHEDFTKRWPLTSKISFYSGIKEAIYLSQQPTLIQQFTVKKNIIYFRPEPWTAQYYNGPLNFFDETLLSLATDNKIIILPRDENQAKHYRQKQFTQISVAENPIDLQDIISNCRLFIGAGGSMTRELAVLGIPVISIYQAKMLCVDKYLIENGLMEIKPEITYQEIKIILSKEDTIKTDLSILEEGKSAYSLIKNLIINLR